MEYPIFPFERKILVRGETTDLGGKDILSPIAFLL